MYTILGPCFVSWILKINWWSCRKDNWITEWFQNQAMQECCVFIQEWHDVLCVFIQEWHAVLCVFIQEWHDVLCVFIQEWHDVLCVFIQEWHHVLCVFIQEWHHVLWVRGLPHLHGVADPESHPAVDRDRGSGPPQGGVHLLQGPCCWCTCQGIIPFQSLIWF